MNLQGDHSRDYFSRRRSPNDLLHFGDDDSGYVEGKVFMTWPPRNRQHRINLEVAEDSVLYRFEVEVPHNDGITFRPHERISVALKGMKVDRRKESSAPHCFPIVLRFPDGVILKYLSGINAGKVVNTWQGNTDEWYNPGTVHNVSDAVRIDTSEICHGPIPTVTCPSMSTINVPRWDMDANRPPLPSIQVSDGAAVAQSTRPPPQHSGGRSSKRPRRKRKLPKEKERALPLSNQSTAEADNLPPAPITTPCWKQPETPIASGPGNNETSIQENGIENSRGNNADNTLTVPDEAVLQLMAGVRTQRGDIFTPLSKFQKGHCMINVIAIVAHVTEKKTSTNEWCRSITLMDPSIAASLPQGIKANCFQKKYPEWLPQVEKDDVVILRKLKVVEYNGTVTATGYGDKLRWAVYDPFQHSIRPPKKGNAPEKEVIDDGMGYEYSPYWVPFQDSIEVEHCRKIGEWWKAMRTLEGYNVSTVKCSVVKQHLLISQASPDLPPNGFFNCTVEVLRKFDNPCGATTIYVTDYTANTLVQPVQATWCPPQLAGWVMQCNMWDSARNIARMMNAGEYWYLHNIRARWNPNHYMECTMQLAEKVTQLDESKLEPQPHLRALLARKKEFESNHSDLTSGVAPMHVFPEILLQDVEETTSFLTCIVELLHIDLNSRDGHFLYVTDYTYNPDLPITVPTATWACDLEHRVVKIKLDDAQAKASSDFTPGNVYVIQNMRIRRSGISGGMHGCLGGDDTLVIPFHDSSSYQAQRLQRNKEKWERENMLSSSTSVLNQSAEGTDVLLDQSSVLFACSASIEFRVYARVMDFFPFSLEDACVLRCTNCKSSLPPSYQRCLHCDDMLETHCKWFYCLYLLLQDEKGNEFIVSLSGKECELLRDIDPTDFRYDQPAFQKFLEKLNPVLGNLRDVHIAWSRNEDEVIKSPLMTFTLESWNVGDEKGYGLLECTP